MVPALASASLSAYASSTTARRCGRHVRATLRSTRASDTKVAGVEFVCPRCAAPVEDRFYGPCEPCRTQLRAQFRHEGRMVEVAEYEPKMNVTPNAVALKDD